jgi:hypothetical protein
MAHMICTFSHHERKPSKAVEACYTMMYRRLRYGDLGSGQIEFSEDGIYQLMHQCNSCLMAGGDIHIYIFFLTFVIPAQVNILQLVSVDMPHTYC